MDMANYFLREIAAAGAIPVLVSLARDGSDAGKKNAARTLWNLAKNDDNKVSIVHRARDRTTLEAGDSCYGPKSSDSAAIGAGH